jgi:hypothetical protein
MCYKILTSVIVRILFEWIGADKMLRRWHRRLSRRSARPKSALTKKELLSLGVVKGTDSSVIPETAKSKIVNLLAESGCITRRMEKDPHFLTPLSIDIETLFLHLAPVLETAVVDRLNPVYDEQSLACIVMLPAPRDSKSMVAARFQVALADCLSSLKIPIEFFTPAVVRGELEPGSIARTKETERILIVQPMAMNDDYLHHTISNIRAHSVSEIAEVLTLVDPRDRPESARSTKPRERVIIELDLTDQKVERPIHEGS